MSIKPEYLKLFVNATEKAAHGASKFIGKNDKIAADKAAVDEMRKELNKLNNLLTCQKIEYVLVYSSHTFLQFL